MTMVESLPAKYPMLMHAMSSLLPSGEIRDLYLAEASLEEKTGLWLLHSGSIIGLDLSTRVRLSRSGAGSRACL